MRGGGRSIVMSKGVPGGEKEPPMPLSEDDQRRLDEIERALQRDDPKFAAGHSLERLRQRRLVAAGAVVLIGMVLLVGVIISVAGFLTMVGGAAVLIRRRRG